VALVSRAAAQDVLVVEASVEDHAVANKLQELVSEPLERRSAESVAGLDLSRGLGCTTGARLELVLDSVHDAVRLVRCRDGSVLTRAIDPRAARDTPYVGAFVAAELLALDSELGSVVVEPRVTPPPPPAAGAAAASPQPPAAARSPVQRRLRLGAEAIVYGGPFAGAFRPTLGLGLAIDSGWAPLAWQLEIHVAAFGAGSVPVGQEQIELMRHDAQLRAGILYRLGPLSLSALVFGRGSLTDAELAPYSNTQVRWGLGAGAGAELTLAAWALLYAELTADMATSRSDYQVDKVPLAQDPTWLVSCGVGLLLRGWL
jgi:hypothetical protein